MEFPTYNPRRARVHRFYGNFDPAAGTASWQTFNIPKAASMVCITLIGAGSGGGGGFTAASSAAKGGGGAGSSGAMSRAIFMASTLPRMLYISVPEGGRGSTGSGVAGKSAVRAFVSAIWNSTVAADLVMVSGAAAAIGGVAGTAAGGQAAGAAETITTNAACAYLGLAVSWTAIAGIIGGAAGALGAAGVAATWGGVGIPIMGGGGGGSGTTSTAEFAGGACTAAGGFMATVAGGTNAGTTPANNGKDGYSLITGYPVFAAMGGGGGGTGDAGTEVGGKGGDGGIGCGGGGGGAGITGGAGGNGGPALCTIEWW